MLPTLLFCTYELIILGWRDFYLQKMDEIKFDMADAGSGISAMASSPSYFDLMKRHFADNFVVLKQEVGGGPRVFIYITVFFSLLIGLIVRLRVSSNARSFQFLCLALLCSVAVYLFWWLTFNGTGWYRHVSPAVTVFEFAAIGSGLAVLGKKGFAPAILGVLLWMFLTPFDWFDLLGFPGAPKSQLYQLKHASLKLAKLRSEGKILFGCGWWANRALEYFMPDTLNFKGVAVEFLIQKPRKFCTCD